MNIDSLPTDNLYKFIALSGLAMILFSVAYLKPIIMNLEIEETKLAAEVRYLKELKTEGVDINKFLTHEKILEWKIKAEVLLKNIEQLEEISTYSKVLSWLGGFFMSIGFYLWYYRVQKPIDVSLIDKINK